MPSVAGRDVASYSHATERRMAYEKKAKNGTVANLCYQGNRGKTSVSKYATVRHPSPLLMGDIGINQEKKLALRRPTGRFALRRKIIFYIFFQ